MVKISSSNLEKFIKHLSVQVQCIVIDFAWKNHLEYDKVQISKDANEIYKELYSNNKIDCVQRQIFGKENYDKLIML
jgi:hypothetical protein